MNFRLKSFCSGEKRGQIQVINRLNIDFLNKNKIRLQISLDSIDEEIGKKTRPNLNHKQLIDTILELHSLGIKVNVMGTLTKDNIYHAPNMYIFFSSRGIGVGFFQFKNNGGLKRNLKPNLWDLLWLFESINNISGSHFEAFEIIKVVDQMMMFDQGYPIMHCGAGLNSISISPEGEIFPCVKLSNIKNKITNINDWNFKKATPMSLVDEIKKCKTCKIKYFCGGGCRAEYQNGQPVHENCMIYEGLILYFFVKVFDLISADSIIQQVG